jgi:hypothetical protein
MTKFKHHPQKAQISAKLKRKGRHYASYVLYRCAAFDMHHKNTKIYPVDLK